jgi:hypothetical protein
MQKPIILWLVFLLLVILSTWQYLTWYQDKTTEFDWRIKGKEWDFQDKKNQELITQDNKTKENDSLQREIKHFSYLKEVDVNEIVVYEMVDFGLKYIQKEDIHYEFTIYNLCSANYLDEEWINKNEENIDFVRKKNFLGLDRSEHIDKQNLTSWLGAYFLRKFNIETFYKKYKHLLFMQLPDTTYKKMFAGYVDELIEVYDYMEKIPDSEVYYKQFNKNNKILSTKPMLDEKFLSEYKNDENGNLNSYVFWLHSFWGRRYDEGHKEQVYHVLVDLQNHYKSKR